MLKGKHQQLSLHYMLYDRIPENHLLKKIDRTVDFSFVNEMLGGSYNKYCGRPAIKPVMIVKLLILKYLYVLSDVQVINETNLNLAYKWFIGLNPEDELPSASLLAKFRTKKLKGTMLNDIFEEIARQCIEKGFDKPTGKFDDSSDKLAPERIMKRLAHMLK